MRLFRIRLLTGGIIAGKLRLLLHSLPIIIRLVFEMIALQDIHLCDRLPSTAYLVHGFFGTTQSSDCLQPICLTYGFAWHTTYVETAGSPQLTDLSQCLT